MSKIKCDSPEKFKAFLETVNSRGRVLFAIRRKATLSNPMVSVDDYLEFCEERYCVVFRDGRIFGVNDGDISYGRYFVFNKLEEAFDACREVENGKVVTEMDALLGLIEYDKKISEPFSRWGLTFELADNGNIRLQANDITKMAIIPNAGNAITIESLSRVWIDN